MKKTLLPIIVAGLLAFISHQIQNEYFLRVGFMLCVYYLCAAGMNCLVGYAGQKSLGQAGLFAAGAYGVALLTSMTEMSPWLALLISVGISGGFGILIAVPSLRVKGPYLAMVTMAFGIVVERIVSEWSDVFGGAGGIYGIRSLTWNDAPFTMSQWVLFAIGLCLVVHLVISNMVTSRFGRALLSLQADEIAASSVGVKVHRAKVDAFIVAAITCGLAGALVAQQNQYINSDFINFNLSIFILLLVLIGGVGNIYGPIFGALVLTLADAGLARWPAVQHLVYGFMLLFALYIMPNGIAGVFTKLFTRKVSGTPEMNVPEHDDLSAIIPVSKNAGNLLTVDKLSKAYGGVRPAKEVSFQLQRGHVHALIGPNGAGKSTMINMLTGVVTPDSGTIDFCGNSLVGAKAHDICSMGIGRTFQNLRLFPDLSVLENVVTGQHSRMRNGYIGCMFSTPHSRQEEVRATEKAIAILDYVGLRHFASLPAGSLPYGLQRRVELARALATEPQLLLLDEPAAGLNPQETRELGDLLKKIARSGMTILMVEHHMDLVMEISDHVIVLDYGTKIAEGTPERIQNDPVVLEAYLGSDAVEEVTENDTPQAGQGYVGNGKLEGPAHV